MHSLVILRDVVKSTEALDAAMRVPHTNILCNNKKAIQENILYSLFSHFIGHCVADRRNIRRPK
jgi:hypothetical protein